MKQEILKIINENIVILHETISNFQKMKDSHPMKKQFVERTKEDIVWMLEFKNSIGTNQK